MHHLFKLQSRKSFYPSDEPPEGVNRNNHGGHHDHGPTQRVHFAKLSIEFG